MAKPIPNLGPQRRDAGGQQTPPPQKTGAAPAPASVPVPAELDVWSTDDSLRQEMERLADENRQMMAGVDGGDLSEELARVQAENEELRVLVAELRQSQPAGGQGDDLTALRTENEELHRHLDEVQQHLETSSQGEEVWSARQKEYEELVEQKSEIIRTLHLKIQELETRPAPEPASPHQHPGGSGISEDDLHQMAEELERERQELEEARRQLEDDERTMMQQMRDMEMQMSRERAELARQRNELQRLHSDIRHELDRAKKDDGLGERLRLLQRRHAEVTGRGGAGAAPAGEPVPAEPPAPAPAPGVAPRKPARDSGLLRRLFGQGK